MKRPLLAVMLAASLVSLNAHADQNDPRLDDLFMKLKKADDQAQALPIEQSIWKIWIENSNSQYQNLMLQGIVQMNRDDMAGALATYTHLVDIAPDYAEAWNKRATIYYMMGEFQKSQQDIEQTLKLEPYHFGALSGLGLIELAQKHYFKARNAFHDALEVYPTMQGVKGNLQAIDRYLDRQSI